MDQAYYWLGMAAQVIGAVTVLATIIVRITPSKKDDITIEDLSSKAWKYINMLPTIGINPKTKAIESAYRDALTNA